jgi:hypothetical protein
MMICKNMNVLYEVIYTVQPPNQPTKQPSNQVEHSLSSEANRASASHEIPHILWNLDVHYLPLVPI